MALLRLGNSPSIFQPHTRKTDRPTNRERKLPPFGKLSPSTCQFMRYPQTRAKTATAASEITTAATLKPVSLFSKCHRPSWSSQNAVMPQNSGPPPHRAGCCVLYPSAHTDAIGTPHCGRQAVKLAMILPRKRLSNTPLKFGVPS